MGPLAEAVVVVESLMGNGEWGLKCHLFGKMWILAKRGGWGGWGGVKNTKKGSILGIFFRPLVRREILFATPQTFMQVHFRVPVSSFRVWGGPHPNIYY